MRFAIEDVGSDAVVNLTALGRLDLGFTSRELKADEVGRVDALFMSGAGTAVAVNAGNPVTGLTKDQLVRIFTGKITDRSAVGGQPGPISVLLREQDSSTRAGFNAYLSEDETPGYASSAEERDHGLGLCPDQNVSSTCCRGRSGLAAGLLSDRACRACTARCCSRGLVSPSCRSTA